LVYTEEEWAAMAERGRERAAALVAQFRTFMEEDPDYAVGFLVCQIGQMLLGGGALLRIVRSIRRGIPGGDRPNLDAPDQSEAPESIVRDPEGNGAPTPNGPARQPEGQVVPEYRTPDDPNAVPYSSAPDNGGIPRYGVPGRYDGPTPDDVERRELGITPAPGPQRLRNIQDLADEARSGQDLAANGYTVETLPDGPNSPSPYGPGDYGYDPDAPNTRRPDYRINGVIFDHFSPSSPRALQDQIQKKVDNGQSRNFVARIGRDGGPPLSEYLAAAREVAARTGDTKVNFAQIIIVDSRTGRIVTFTNPNFSPN
jgi:hypothetical protein